MHPHKALPLRQVFMFYVHTLIYVQTGDKLKDKMVMLFGLGCLST